MAKPGDVIDVPELGVRVVFLATAESTGGAYTEVDVIGEPEGLHHRRPRPRGRDRAPHGDRGRDAGEAARQAHVLKPGDEITIPPDTPHTQQPGSKEQGRIRIRLTPSARSDEFFERLARARLQPLRLPQAALGREVRARARRGRPRGPPEPEDPAADRARCSTTEYTFVDEWDVAAPREDVFDTLADGTTYPAWWKPVYIDATHDGEYTLQHFKGRLPYHLHTRTRTTHSERPHRAPGRDRRRPARHRHLDAERERRRLHPRALRLARARRPPAAEGPDAVPAARPALEPQLGDRPRDGGPRALRARHAKLRA